MAIQRHANNYDEAKVPHFYGAPNQRGFSVHASRRTGGGAGLATPVSVNPFTQMAANDTIEVLSSSVADTTQAITIEGITSTGLRRSEVLTLNGTTAVISVNTYSYFERAFLSAAAVGTVTIQRTTGPTLMTTITIGQLSAYIAHFFFINSEGNARGAVTYWDAILRTAAEDLNAELRYYPDAASCRAAAMATGFVLWDSIQTANAMRLNGKQRLFHCPKSNQPGTNHQGGYVAVVAADVGGSDALFDVSLEGFLEE
mgnify:FL=1